MAIHPLEKAIQIARKAHKGQTDKAGKPYIGHPIRVMKMCRSEKEKIVAVLHDVIEDTAWTPEILQKEGGFSDEIMEALHCVTKRNKWDASLPEETYEQFIERAASNPIATAVKINDLKDNMDITRLPSVKEEDINRIRKYLLAYQRLLPLYEKRRRKILYFDMDNVLVDSGVLADKSCRHTPGIFSELKPLPGAIEAVKTLSEYYDVFILSTAPLRNPSSWSDKFLWVEKYFPEGIFDKHITLTHRKDLAKGDYLIDDTERNGVLSFEGEHIHFGSPEFPDWKAVTKYLVGIES